jgi:heavy metal sensor kinase
MLKHNISISLRLTAWFGSIFFLGWLLFGTAMGFNLNRTLTGERRQTLDRRLDRLQDLLRAGTTENEADRAQDFKDFARATGNGLAEIFTPDGRHVYPSPSSNAANFPWPGVRLDHKEAFLPVDFAGQPYWVMSRPFALGPERVILLVAAPGTGNRVVLDNFWRGLMASVPILLLISSMGGYWISRRALKPVDQITSTARSIGIRNLSERLPVTDSSDELQRLAETCNEMLERIESAVKRLKQFTADASHELRGPLSLTRTVAEVALRNPGADELSREAFRDIVEESVKASELLDQMLLLARADVEQVGMEMSAVDLGWVLQEAYGMAEKIAEEKGLELTLSSSEHANFEVMGSFSSLRRLLWIVLDNALKYTNTPGRVCVSLCAEGLHAVVRISDTGISISDADLPYIFDRFYRADPSRSKVEGNGLGLSIAKWIADVHHAEMLVSTKAGAGTLFTIRLPLLTHVG